MEVLLFFILIVMAGATLFFAWTLVVLFFTRVPLISTPFPVIRKMIELADLKPGQKVYDLGCGRGNILFVAEKKGVHCTGYDLLRPALWIAKLKKKWKKSSVEFHCADFFKADLRDGDVIFCYLWPSIMERFQREKWGELKRGTRVISHGFEMKTLRPVQVEKIGRATVYVYQKES